MRAAWFSVSLWWALFWRVVMILAVVVAGTVALGLWIRAVLMAAGVL